MLTLIALTSLAHSQEKSESAAVWPQWRGPHRDGYVSKSETWPNRLDDETLKQSWRVPLGPSYSGPIVSDSLVFVTETENEKNETVRALDRHTGEERWSTTWKGSLSVPFFAKSNGDWIRSTPAYDGERLYVAGMRDLLVCLDAETGKTLWRVDFVDRLKSPVPAFGLVCSPLVDGDFVYVQAGAAFCKLNKLTGEIIWRALDDGGGMFGSAFSSPYLFESAGIRQILVQTRTKLASVDPESGTVLWSQEIPAFRGMNILTPIVDNNAVFTSSYGGKSFFYQMKSTDDQHAVTEKWTNKATGYMSSPVIIGGHVYLHLRNQRLTCLELATGETKWTSQPYGKYWSLVTNGEQILALDERGDLLLIRANPEKFELLDTRHVSDESTWAHLAVCGDEVFVRELNALSHFVWKNTKTE
ncbi:MAG: PQQ-binding-like beta-propeller repeat protein [Planctomycetota bacterium]|nr:PQQ-binding-like beta-propeller repeat protein [Planctomycetota bacterium]